jgi:S1-C subfamily serine protease
LIFTERSQSAALTSEGRTGTVFFITDDGYLISNYHVVKDATKVRLLTSAGLIDAKVVQVDAANNLALLKANAEGRMKNEETFKPLRIAASRRVALGGTVATVGFPDIGLQGFAPKVAKGEIASLSGAEDDPRYFQISVPGSRAIRAGRWWMSVSKNGSNAPVAPLSGRRKVFWCDREASQPESLCVRGR